MTPYKAIPANFDDFAVKAAGQDAATPLAENSESIMSGRHYTLVIFPDATAANAMNPTKAKEARAQCDRGRSAAAVRG